MSEIKIPALEKFQKETVEFDVGYRVYNDIAYVYTIRDYRFLIEHQEEEYGNDTHGWCVFIEGPHQTYHVISKCLSKETAYKQLMHFVSDKRLASKMDYTMLSKLEGDIKELRAKITDYNTKTDVRVTRTSDYIGCQKCGSKLSRQYLKSSKCPLCGDDLRSNTVIKHVIVMQSRLLEMEDTYKQLKNGKILY